MPFAPNALHPSSDGDRGDIDVVGTRDVCSCVLRNVLRPLLLLLAASPAVFQRPVLAQVRPPVDGGLTVSLGQPRHWIWTVGASTSALNNAGVDGLNGQLRLGLARPIGNPVVLGFTLGAEGYAGAFAGRPDGGVRARLAMPLARIAAGIDLSARTGAAHPSYSFTHPLRRGGLFRDGSMLRLDYMPTRGQSVTAGIEIPIAREVPTGRTRPARSQVHITEPPRARAAPVVDAPGLDAALREAAAAARMIRLLNVPFLGRDVAGHRRTRGTVPEALRELASALPGTPGSAAVTIETEATRFHDAIERAFASVLDRDVPGMRRARAAAQAARRTILEHVLLPYDRLLGQRRTPDSILRLAHRAQGVFIRWLHSNGASTGREADDAVSVFTSVLDIIEANHEAIAQQWYEERFHWLPLQFGLRPEEHQTQSQLDSIVALATRSEFTEGNYVSYVINEQFQVELKRTILSAEAYHVLVTHDFRGIDDAGDPDTVAFEQVVNGYLAAMTARVRDYDRTGTFPTYLILHDQWYYSLREAPLFLRLLEQPLDHRVRLPRAFAAWEEAIERAQAALRRAVEGSSLLQAQRRQYGDAWLRNLVRVHVNVTNRADPTFWSWTLVPGLPLHDNMLRDHRKLVFYDVSEAHPYAGEAIYTGAGVGEHYTDGSWEDRSLLVSGPALLDLKAAARKLLLDQGLTPEEIPFVLQPRERSADYERLIAREAPGRLRPFRAMGVHNESGFGQKDVNVAKAVLYTLMPSGSVIIIPDSFWNSEFWGSALFGAALRGVRVMVIAPSHASNSVEVRGTQLLTRELLSRLLVARTVFASPLAASGGMLRIGIFDSEIRVFDIPLKVRAVQQKFAAHGWLQEFFDFPPEVYQELAELANRLDSLLTIPDSARASMNGARTRIHLKSNLFASREAWTMMRLPTWGEITNAFVLGRVGQVQRAARLSAADTSDAGSTLPDPGAPYLPTWYDSLHLGDRERVVFYTIMGSQNQNGRSMIMDAEDALVVAKWPATIAYLDAISLIAQSQWVETQAEIDRYLPAMPAWLTLLTHWGRLAF